jgi:GT2 family glycosyltransferase
MKPEVTIVIPNFNGAALLRSNLPAVLEAARTYREDTRVIVVDDGSSDDSIRVMQELFPEIGLVVHERNKGFSEAVYSGISEAQSDLVFLLNSDVQPDQDVIQPLTEYFAEADTFAVGPVIRDERGNVDRHSWNIREFYHGNLKPVDWELQQALDARRQKRLLTIYASGGSVLLRKSMFMALGGFHPIYKPFYGEDYDLGLRAWERGWRSYFEPRVGVTHQRNTGSSIKTNVCRTYVKRVRRRNKLLLEWIHLPAGRLWGSVIPLAIWQLLGEMLTLDKVNVMGFLDALPRIPVVLQARRELAANRKLALNQVLDEIAG